MVLKCSSLDVEHLIRKPWFSKSVVFLGHVEPCRSCIWRIYTDINAPPPLSSIHRRCSFLSGPSVSLIASAPPLGGLPVIWIWSEAWHRSVGNIHVEYFTLDYLSYMWFLEKQKKPQSAKFEISPKPTEREGSMDDIQWICISELEVDPWNYSFAFGCLIRDLTADFYISY